MARKRDTIGLLFVCGLFALSVAVWVFEIPFDRAPDEWTHYYYNVRFLLANARLPVMGVDDRSAFETAVGLPQGRLVSRYSYTNAPALCYVLYAACAWIGPLMTALDPISSARLLSLVWGEIFVGAVYGTALVIGCRPSVALAAAAAAAFIPQVQFLACYINNDAYSLTASACLLWATAWDGKRRTLGSFIFMGAAVGWVVTAKFQYWVYLPFSAMWMIARVYATDASLSGRFRMAAAWALAATAVGGFWIGRNIALYGDPTGLDRMLSQMRAVQGLTLEPTLTGATLAALVDQGFVTKTLMSAFMTFDYMSLAIQPSLVYALVGAATAAFAVAAFGTIVAERDRSAIRGAIALALFGGCVIAPHVYNSIYWDFQPQGRYLYPLLAPLAVYVAWIAERHARLRIVVWSFVAMMLVATVLAHDTVSAAYRGIDREREAAVRNRPFETAPQALVEVDLPDPRPHLRAVVVQRSAPEPDDVAFYGVELIDVSSGAVIRRAYMPPHQWRAMSEPTFVFRPLADSDRRRLRVRLFSEEPGVVSLDGSAIQIWAGY